MQKEETKRQYEQLLDSHFQVFAKDKSNLAYGFEFIGMSLRIFGLQLSQSDIMEVG